MLPDTTGVWISAGSTTDPHALIMVSPLAGGELTPSYIGVRVAQEITRTG